jgi:hypothetical protein
VRIWLAVFRSGLGVRLWVVCIYVRIGVCGYGLSVSRSGYGSECMAGCI